METIKDIETFETGQPENSILLTLLKDRDWITTADCATSPDCLKLQEGNKYLFSENLSCFNPKLIVKEIIDNSAQIQSDMLSSRDSSGMAIQGEISEFRFVKSVRGDDMVYAKFRNLPEIDIIFFPDLYNDFCRAINKDINLTIIGVLDLQRPQLI
jgi:hypothetical protein